MPESESELLMQVARSLRRRWGALLSPWELSPHQARALRVVCDHDGPRLSAVAEALRIAPRSATEVVDGLEAHGLVKRVPDPVDRRGVCVLPTEEGCRLREEIDRARGVDAEEFFGRLSPEDRTALGRILRTLND